MEMQRDGIERCGLINYGKNIGIDETIKKLKQLVLI